MRQLVDSSNPILYAPAEDVPDISQRLLLEVVGEMQEVMVAHFGVGLAAPQVGIPWRLMIFLNSDGETQALLNPTIIAGSGLSSMTEGCLSLPGEFYAVQRNKTVVVSALDINREPVEIQASGFHAHVLQHEIDHLEGRLISRFGSNAVGPVL